MFNINDIKNGITFLFEGNIYTVIEFQHVKPGKGAAFVKAKIRNLRTGSIVEKTFNTSIKLEKAMITKQNMQYLYNTGDVYYFMNMETYEQIELSKDQIGDAAKYLIENLSVNITFYEGEMLGMELPEKIESYSELLKKTITREQRIAYNKTNIDYNGNFYIDEYGITYVFNSDKYLDEFDATIHVLLDPKIVRQQAKNESIVYKFFNIGQVERAKAKKQNKTIATN